MIRKGLLWSLGALAVFILAVIIYNLSWWNSPHGDGPELKNHAH